MVIATPQKAPLAKILTIKTYRHAKIGGEFLVLIAVIFLATAGISSEWLWRYYEMKPSGDENFSCNNASTSFYRYGIFEICYGFINREAGEITNGTCEFHLHKNWVQDICAGFYCVAVLTGFVTFFLLLAAITLDTDNLLKWQLYKASIAFLFAAGFTLFACLLIWLARFLTEVLILPSAYYPSALSMQQLNATITTDVDGGEQVAGLLSSSSSSVVISTSISSGWAYILAWFGAVLLTLPPIFMVIDGKKDEHVLQEETILTKLSSSA